MKDWLGYEYGPGDKVLYAALNGRSATMVLAEVVSINDTGTVTVQPLNSARWKQHDIPSWYEDERTGKRINIWGQDGEHIKTAGHYVHKDTREKLTYNHGCYHTPSGQCVDYGDREYVQRVLQPWVKECSADKPKKVTLRITQNITKLPGDEAAKLLTEALFLRTNGERPPGAPESDPKAETWADWDRRCELFLRSLLD